MFIKSMGFDIICSKFAYNINADLTVTVSEGKNILLKALNFEKRIKIKQSPDSNCFIEFFHFLSKLLTKITHLLVLA